jgi:hypothetical protein
MAFMIIASNATSLLEGERHLSTIWLISSRVLYPGKKFLAAEAVYEAIPERMTSIATCGSPTQVNI